MAHLVISTHASTCGVASVHHQVPVPRTKSTLGSFRHFYPRFSLWSCLRSPSSSRSSKTKSTPCLILSRLPVEFPPLTIKFPFPKPSLPLAHFVICTCGVASVNHQIPVPQTKSNSRFFYSSRLRLVSPLSKSIPPVPSSIPPQNSEITLQLGQRKN